jgi:predicted nuclease of predicted toxin-antitoxin system
MRFLANENFPASAVTALRAKGHDVAWVRMIAPGSSDRGVLERAEREGRILLTFDRDFGELVFKLGLRPSTGVVFFRIPLLSPAYVANAVVRALDSRSDWVGLFAVVEEDRIRVRNWLQR